MENDENTIFDALLIKTTKQIYCSQHWKVAKHTHYIYY